MWVFGWNWYDKVLISLKSILSNYADYENDFWIVLWQRVHTNVYVLCFYILLICSGRYYQFLLMRVCSSVIDETLKTIDDFSRR